MVGNELVVLDGSVSPDILHILMDTIEAQKSLGTDSKATVRLTDSITLTLKRGFNAYEYNAIKFIRANTKMPVPVPIALVALGKHDYMLTEHIDGKTVQELCGDMSATEAASKFPRLWSQVKNAMSELYSVDVTQLLGPDASKMAGWPDSFKRARPTSAIKSEYSLVEISDRKKYSAQVGMYTGYGSVLEMLSWMWRPDQKSVLCHGDLGCESILVTSSGDLAAIVNWSNAKVALATNDGITAALSHESFDYLPLYVPDHILAEYPIAIETGSQHS